MMSSRREADVARATGLAFKMRVTLVFRETWKGISFFTESSTGHLIWVNPEAAPVPVREE